MRTAQTSRDFNPFYLPLKTTISPFFRIFSGIFDEYFFGWFIKETKKKCLSGTTSWVFADWDFI